MTRTARLKAYAKLNLGLRVLYKRPDGYHELRTVFQTISLADRIAMTFAAAKKTRIRIDGTPDIPDNLAGRAAQLVLDELGICADVHVLLEKRIPSGAGLGGGSTDAAAVLIALPVLAGRALSPHRLFELGAQLGSDVPFFLHGGTALGLGRGEELYPLPDLPRRKVLLIAPKVHSSTADAYRDLSLRLTSIGLQNKLFSFQQEIWRGLVSQRPFQPGNTIAAANDFEDVVFDRHPELRQIRDRLLRAGAKPASMTGSGSAIFGIFDDFRLLEQARKSFHDEQTFVLSFLSRAQYRSDWIRALGSHIVQHPKPNTGDIWQPQSRYAR